MRGVRQVEAAGALRAKVRRLAIAAAVAVLAPPVGGHETLEASVPLQAEESEKGGRSGMIERHAAAAERLEVWLAEREERTGFRLSPLGIDIAGWSFFRVSLTPEPGLEELGEEARYHAVRDDGSVVTGPAERELAALFRAVGLGGGVPPVRLEALSRAVLVLAGRGASVVAGEDAPELTRRFEGLVFAGPSLGSAMGGVVLAFQARADAGPGRAPLTFLLVRASVDASGEARLAIEEREVRPAPLR